VAARIWRADVGRVPLVLLDTNLESNDPADRHITRHLYGGDDEMRIRQEVLLGIGGMRALAVLGIEPVVCHMNEGHAAFLGFEMIRRLMDRGRLTFDEARQAAAGGLVFTTHTPVPAGIDRFGGRLIEKYLAPFRAELGITAKEFASLGDASANDAGPFSMAVLALKLAGAANGVSRLHARVSRKMWHGIWPGARAGEAPIRAITNGVHSRSWIGPDMSAVLDRHLGLDWDAQRSTGPAWNRVADIPDGELWAARTAQRAELVAFVRRRLAAQCRRRGGSPEALAATEKALDAETLTIGFARRFATYKRGDLLFRNLDRLAAICQDADRPVQFIFSGKAHPRDSGGQAIIERIVTHLADPALAGRIVFIENYDIAVGRALVGGSDVWLNNPIKPREASGTSGMKVPLNGGLNASILDGWWPEAYDGVNGWAIAEAPEGAPDARRDDLESEAIYDLLEKEILPLFYDRDEAGLPRRWLERVKASIRTIVPAFSTDRMVEDYTTHLYMPAIERSRRLATDDYASARSLARWKRNLQSAWPQVAVEGVEFPASASGNGDPVEVRARVRLGSLRPEDVVVEVISDVEGRPDDDAAFDLRYAAPGDDGAHVFEGAVIRRSGAGERYAVRVLPRHPDLPHAFDCGLAALQ
jgi:starch phosphorylase